VTTNGLVEPPQEWRNFCAAVFPRKTCAINKSLNILAKLNTGYWEYRDSRTARGYETGDTAGFKHHEFQFALEPQMVLRALSGNDSHVMPRATTMGDLQKLPAVAIERQDDHHLQRAK
jgi:hypothetical protein